MTREGIVWFTLYIYTRIVLGGGVILWVIVFYTCVVLGGGV